MSFKFEDLINKSVATLQSMRVTKDELLSLANHPGLFDWIKDMNIDSAKIYDKAMDATYNSVKEGGGNHRLFDGGHSLFEAWDKVRNANPDDTFLQEVVGYMSALWNDASTLKGLPFQTLEKATYEEWVESITKTFPGVSKEWLHDLHSFDAIELTSSFAGIITAVFQLKNEDKLKFDQLIGSMGVSSIMGANPVMGICVIGLAGYSYYYKKNGLDKKSLGKGASATAFSAILFSALGLPFLIELIIVMFAANYFRKHVLEKDEIISLIKNHVKTRLELFVKTAGKKWDLFKTG